MELKDFVSETLKHVLAGVQEAQSYAAEHGGNVVPGESVMGGSKMNRLISYEDGTPIEEIEFDVAVVTVEGTATKGGIGIFVGPVGAGSQGEMNSSNQSTSRIKFAVPVNFPKQSEYAQQVAPLDAASRRG